MENFLEDTSPHVQTQACENITFPQLLLRAVTKFQ